MCIKHGVINVQSIDKIENTKNYSPEKLHVQVVALYKTN